MTKDVNEVNWGALETAYGSAESVGASLKALATADTKRRAAAIDDLESSIHHQFSRYSASAAALPFLVALVADPTRDDRVAILKLLYGLTVGEPTLDAWDIRDAGLRRYVGEAGVAAYEASREHLATYIALLDDANADVRVTAAFLLGAFADRAAEILPAMRARSAREDDPWCRAAMFLALRSLAVASTPVDTKDVAELDGIVAKGKPTEGPPVVAALARIEIAGEHPAAVALLKKVKKLTPPAGFPGNLGRYVQAWVGDLALRRPVEALLAWLEAPPVPWDWQKPASDADGLSCLSVTERLLQRTLPARETIDYRLASTIPELGYRTLIAAIRCGVIGETNHYNSYLVKFGLPPVRSIRRYLGVDPPTPLEKSVGKGERAQPIWRWIKGAMIGTVSEDAALATVIEGLSVDERVALLSVDGILSEYAFENGAFVGLKGSSHHLWQEALRRVQAFFGSLFVSVGSESVERAAEATLAKKDIWLNAPLVVALARLATTHAAAFPARFLPLWENLPPIAPLAREALATVAPEAREAVLEHWNFNLATIHPVDEHGVSDERKGDHELGWAYLLADLCPTPRVAERMIEHVSRWTYPEHPKPVDATVALARTMGAVVVPPALAALRDAKLKDYRWRHVLVEILAAVAPSEAAPFVLELSMGKPHEKKVAKRLSAELASSKKR